MAMDRKTKKVLMWLAIAVVGVYVFLGVKECKSNRNKAELKARAEIAESLLAGESELESENKTLVLQNDSLRKDLAVAGDSIVALNDSIDVLNTKNTKLKNEKDSIVAELDDCKASKQPAKKTPAKKTPTVVSKPEKEPEKPAVVKPMPRVQKPCEPIVIKQKAKNENTGSTTINVNTPGNTVNISNGGIINNFYGDTAKVEAVYKEVAKYQRKIIMGHAVSNESVRCK